MKFIFDHKKVVNFGKKMIRQKQKELIMYSRCLIIYKVRQDLLFPQFLYFELFVNKL